MGKSTIISGLFVALVLCACGKENPSGEQAQPKRELTVLFSPGVSFSGAGYDDAILKAVVESMAEHPQVNHSLLRPETLDMRPWPHPFLRARAVSCCWTAVKPWKTALPPYNSSAMAALTLRGPCVGAFLMCISSRPWTETA